LTQNHNPARVRDFLKGILSSPREERSMPSEMLALCFFVVLLAALIHLALGSESVHRHRRRAAHSVSLPAKSRRCQPKRPWVRDEVLRLKARMPKDGCRVVALAFNFLHGRRETVGKTYVANTLRRHAEEVLRLRRELKHRKPRPLPRNVIWGLDLTYLPGRRPPILAILDHGTRACLLLAELRTKSAIALVRAVVTAARKYGLPRSIRTDNEANFCSLTFRAALWLLGVRHRRTAPHCPWQNGRVEKYFATFKDRMLPRLADLRAVGPEPVSLQGELDLFRLWHNHVRPHQHLDGCRPAEAWDGIRTIAERRPRQRHLFSEWEGLLTGYL
jgi:putative transposase